MISITKRNTKEKETRLNMAFIENVNLSIEDSESSNSTRLEVKNGNSANIFAESWQNSSKSYRMSIISFFDLKNSKQQRQLGIAIVSPKYVMQIELEHAEVKYL